MSTKKNPMVVQSVLFDKKKYNKTKAEKWLKENGFKVKKVDITESLRRYRQLDPKLFDSKSYRMRNIKGKEIRLVVGKRLKKK
tara:strand:+ start:7037 stop:7285 length:249 start_codon:yes stop_codon:yes gene_type:complete